MITVKCTYSNGDTIITRINASLEEAKDYFLHRWFNIGNGEQDNLQQCTEVDLHLPSNGV
jgi:hypothetical protein